MTFVPADCDKECAHVAPAHITCSLQPRYGTRGVPPTAHSSTTRSELGGLQAVVHPLSLADPGKFNKPQPARHPHVHVDGQSESTVHGPVSSASHLFHRNKLQMLPARHVVLAGAGAALHETVVTVA